MATDTPAGRSARVRHPLPARARDVRHPVERGEGGRIAVDVRDDARGASSPSGQVQVRRAVQRVGSAGSANPDPPAGEAARMSSIEGLLLDIDGVLSVSWEPVPGAVQAMTSLRAAGVPCRLMPN